MDCVPSGGHHLEPRIRQCGGESGPELAELRVVLAGEHQRRRRDRPEPIPQRLLGPGSGRTQAGGESGRSVAQPVGAQGLLGAESGEQRVRQPFVDERLDTDLLDALCEPLVRRSPRSPVGVVVDAACRADQDESAHVVGVAERGVESDPTAHRVADIGRVSADADEVLGTCPEVGIDRRGRVAVAREVDREAVEVVDAGTQQRLEVRPRPCGLGEPMGEDESLGQDPPPIDCNAIL